MHEVTKTWMAGALLAMAICGQAQAAGGPLGIDHEWRRDDRGIWSRKVQLGLEYAVVLTELTGALALGNDDPWGHTAWQTLDASVASAVGAAGLKLVTGRARPNAGLGPDQWGQGRRAKSFPSGEVALQASFVTPIIMARAQQSAWWWALEALPLYDGIARIKSQAHWQTDVLAGWALGTATGYWAAQRQSPVWVQVLPRSVTLGYSSRF